MPHPEERVTKLSDLLSESWVYFRDNVDKTVPAMFAYFYILAAKYSQQPTDSCV